jgi:hypothetical protein
MRNMKPTTAQLKKLGKRAAATAAGLLAAATLALGAVVDSPDELFSGAPQAAQVVICEAEQDSCAPSTPAQPVRKERMRDKLRRLFLAQPSVTRGVALLPLWAIGKVLLSLLSLLFAALSPVLSLLLGVLFNAALLFGLFLVVLKLLFPNLRLRDFLTKKNILLLAAGSLLLSVADVVLKTFWEDYRPISIAIKLTLALIVLSLLCWRIFGKRAPKITAQAT